MRVVIPKHIPVTLPYGTSKEYQKNTSKISQVMLVYLVLCTAQQLEAVEPTTKFKFVTAGLLFELELALP